MNKYNLISLLALLGLIVILPFYALQENERLEVASAALQEEFLLDGSVLYIENCSECHGASGEGIGANPPLNTLGASKADPIMLFKSIARAAHGSSMAAWHLDEGGAFDDYQIERLVTLIQHADWSQVNILAAQNGVNPQEISTMDIQESYLQGLEVEDPHQCVSCHEEPEVHAERFGFDCVRCHSLVAWTPALLTRHTFALDHGDGGTVSCETCHIESYTENTCYECHDHAYDEMAPIHDPEGISDFVNCIKCHPTGAPDEARNIMESAVGKEMSQGK